MATKRTFNREFEVSIEDLVSLKNLLEADLARINRDINRFLQEYPEDTSEYNELIGE